MAAENLVKKLNQLLVKAENHKEIDKLLSNCLQVCADNIFLENCVKWMQACCRTSGTKKVPTVLACFNFQTLTQISTNFPELSRPIANTVVPRFFDIFFKEEEIDTELWQCLKVLITSYGGPCAAYKDRLEEIYSDFLSAKNEMVVSNEAAQCFALLPAIGGGGTGGNIYGKKWTLQVEDLIKSGHVVLSRIFKDANIHETQDYSYYETEIENKFTPGDSFELLVIQIENIVRILQWMFLGKFLTVKSLKTDLVLALICRGLAVSVATLDKEKAKLLETFVDTLPHLHSILLKLLSAVIVCFSRQLMSKAGLITKLIKQTLIQSDLLKPKFEHNQRFIEFRCSIYSVICNWLIVMQSASCLENISKNFLDSALADLTFENPSVALAKDSTKISTRAKVINWRKNERVCLAALKTVSLYLNFHSFMLSADQHKTLQVSTIKQLTAIQQDKSKGESVPVYSISSVCRKELYSLLLKLCLEPHLKWPPPTQFALQIFSRGTCDQNLSIANFCSTALSSLGRILRPEFSVATFPVNFSDLIEKEIVLKDRPISHDNQLINFEVNKTLVEKEITSDNVEEAITEETIVLLTTADKDETERSVIESDLTTGNSQENVSSISGVSSLSLENETSILEDKEDEGTNRREKTPEKEAAKRKPEADLDDAAPNLKLQRIDPSGNDLKPTPNPQSDAMNLRSGRVLTSSPVQRTTKSRSRSDATKMTPSPLDFSTDSHSTGTNSDNHEIIDLLGSFQEVLNDSS